MRTAIAEEGTRMIADNRPSRLEVWLQVILTAVLLMCFSELILTPGFLSLRPMANPSPAALHMGTR